MAFRMTSRLLATATDLGTNQGFKAAPMALLPPIPLYRRLLRAHRKHLPREMRLLGDEYVKSEFRAHRDVENPVHIVSGLLCSCWLRRTQDCSEIEHTSVWRLMFVHNCNWLFQIACLDARRDDLGWLFVLDRIPHRMANVCAETRGWWMDWRKNGYWQDR